MSKTRITVQAGIKADISKVWERWNGIGHIVKWNQASEDWHCPKAVNDLRPGGTFSFTMAANDGSSSFDFEGVYDEVVENRKLAYTMSDGRKVEVHFDTSADGVIITETFDAENTHPIEMQRAGWQAILNSFKSYTLGPM